MSIDLETMSEMHIEPQVVRWLWRPYLAAGKLTILDGDPGTGKSIVTLDIAARLSRGAPMPDGSPGPSSCRSLILNPEDDTADTLAPRLIAAGADFSRILLPRLHNDLDYLQFPRDLQVIERLIRSQEIKLVIIDPLSAFIPFNLPSADQGAARLAVAPLAMLAARTGVAIILVRHLTKRLTDSAVRRGQGSMSIIGLARTALLVARSSSNPDIGLLAVSKTNLASAPDPLAFRLMPRDSSVVVDWLGSAIGSADDAARPSKRREMPGVVRATLWLLEALANGPRPAAELLAAARADGIRERTLERAKQSLRIQSQIKTVEGGRAWLWCPPEEPPEYDFDPYPLDFDRLPYANVEDSPVKLTKEGKKIRDREELAWASKHYRPQQ